MGKQNHETDGAWNTTFHFPSGVSRVESHIPPCEKGKLTEKYLAKYAKEISEWKGHRHAINMSPPETVNEQRDEAMAVVSQHAEDNTPAFAERASEFITEYLRTKNCPLSGEVLTMACKQAGIVPHDDRAFGPVYMSLIKRGVIEKSGTVRRERGHGTAGGNTYRLISGPF
jgi:hypothetical protein